MDDVVRKDALHIRVGLLGRQTDAVAHQSVHSEHQGVALTLPSECVSLNRPGFED